MIPLTTILLFLASALGLLLIPGPSVLYITARSLAHGRRAGLSSVLGIELATLCHTIAAAFGLSAILFASALAFDIVKYAGAGYLIYLGITSILSRNSMPVAGNSAQPTLAQMFRRGFVVNLLNPKTALFFYAFLPQFVDPSRGSPVVQILLLGALFVSFATITDSAYALLASGIGSRAVKWKPFQRIQKYVSGGIYLSLGVGAALAGSGKQ
ncbi:MAG TPA: LysE family translocator [Spirochaetia bacterium]|nr:LysE family translocator [Spirochaetia bacterium]